jgi:cobalamin biosynthesis protein CbiD
MNDRPIAKCQIEILAMANRRVPLRIVEIARLTNTIPQVLQKIERRAMDKLRELIDFDVSELIDDELQQARKRRRVMR